MPVQIFKNFIGFTLMMFLKVPLFKLGMWMMLYGGATQEDWSYFTAGISMLIIAYVWSHIENSAFVRQITGEVSATDAKRLAEIGIALPAKSTVEDAMVILANEKRQAKSENPAPTAKE